MRKVMFSVAAAILLAGASAALVQPPQAEACCGWVRVRGYSTNRGTYVAPHYRTYPDGIFANNWSSRGNYNPYTGRAGYKTDATYFGYPSHSAHSWYPSSSWYR